MSDSTVITLRDVRRRRRRLILRIALAALVLAILIAGALAWRIQQRMKASLPQLDGAATVAELGADVTITRDALGVPAIRAANRLDAARALGFLHAQDRFYQMDITRRRAAGELSELFGEKTLDADKSARLHGLRALAQASLARLPDSQKKLLAAYTEGVNAGLAQLREKPFEYIFLRAEPRPWISEDSILVIHAMAMDLQHPEAIYERTIGVIRDVYDNNVLNYFAPLLAPDDSALDGTKGELAPIPRPSSINLRASSAIAKNTRVPPRVTPAPAWLAEGSNNMAVGGAHGPGIIENDMHLTLRVPNTWYRASMSWDAGGQTNTVTGITHPGAPVIVAGSNGRIAWGFTNSFADTSDLVVLRPDYVSEFSYHTGTDILLTKIRTEIIRIRGQSEPFQLNVETSIWGPIVATNQKNQKIALKWVFHDPAAANYDLVELETATTVAAAIRIANRAGIPAQNMLVTDTAGDIAWTICGRLPDRFGYDGRGPVTWSFGDRGWHGLLPPEKTPALISPASEHLSTANQRLFGGDTLALLGDGGYRSGQRGARIQELLGRLDKKSATPRDLLAIALDDRAPYLARWHKLLRDTLSATTNQKLARLRDAAGETWDESASGARASLDSAAYPIVSKFREHVIARLLTPIFEPCADMYPNFNYNRLHIEEPVWNLLRKQPMHLLAPEYDSWEALLLAAAGDARDDLADAGFSNPANARWGAFNKSRIRHSFSAALPGFVAWMLRLDMPSHELPGDDDMPRVQHPAYGASMRMVVSPGREAEGIFEMPCGQSGHPLSPFYRAGHEAWERGEPTPFLPGETKHTLILKAK